MQNPEAKIGLSSLEGGQCQGFILFYLFGVGNAKGTVVGNLGVAFTQFLANNIV